MNKLIKYKESQIKQILIDIEPNFDIKKIDVDRYKKIGLYTTY